MAQSTGNHTLPEGSIEELGDKIYQDMLNDNFTELSESIGELMSMPQSLCKKQGMCCKLVNFKGLLSFEEVQELAASSEISPEVEAARDFLHLFQPHADQEKAKAEIPEFLRRIKETTPGKDNYTIFKCKYLSDDNLCQIHEDRPTGCRTYPFPHEKTLFHPGCGYEETSKLNLKKINAIQAFFARRQDEMRAESEQFWKEFSLSAAPFISEDKSSI